MSHVLQCVWPIVDATFTRQELIAEASAQIEGMAARARATVTGPPIWYIAEAAKTPGWHSYAPGSLLVGVMPAEPYGHVSRGRGKDADPVAVERIISGHPPARVWTVDRRAAVVAMAAAGVPRSEIASRIGGAVDAVDQTLVRHRRRQRAAA